MLNTAQISNGIRKSHKKIIKNMTIGEGSPSEQFLVERQVPIHLVAIVVPSHQKSKKIRLRV